MARAVGEDELIEHWTLVGDEWTLLAGKRGPTRLGFALLLKFHLNHGRFPRGRSELGDDVVAYIAAQVKVPPSDIAFYEWDGRTIEYHRAQIRTFTGFRECTAADAEKITGWLADHVCRSERRSDRVRVALLEQLNGEGIEPPVTSTLLRMIASALRAAEQMLTLRISGRVPADAARRMLALIARRAGGGDEEESDDEAEDAESPPSGDDDQGACDAAAIEGADLFAVIREEPGNVSVKTMQREVFKLGAINAIELPEGLFDDVAPGVLAAWRSRVAAEAPSHLRRHADELTVTLLAAYLYCRRREIIDALVDLLITTVARINARADTVVTGEFVAELKRVSGKENILFRMTGAALDTPKGPVEEVIYSAVPGGVDTLVALWHEYTSKGSTYRQHRQRVFKASYTHHYRTGLIQILEALEFGSTNTVHAPDDGGPSADQTVQGRAHQPHQVLRHR